MVKNLQYFNDTNYSIMDQKQKEKGGKRYTTNKNPTQERTQGWWKTRQLKEKPLDQKQLPIKNAQSLIQTDGTMVKCMHSCHFVNEALTYQIISDSIFCLPFWISFKQFFDVKLQGLLLRHFSKLFPRVPVKMDNGHSSCRVKNI